MADWTGAQLKAIETLDKTLLISAAAGSGKTTVLIERIIRALTNAEHPADISRMLIVTFTRAAASELRQRISAALTKAIAENPDDKRLFGQLASLGSAHISTIDSFYSDVVRRNAERLDIPFSLRIADDSELSPLRRSLMDKVIERGYEGSLDCDGAAFAEMTETLCDMRNDSALAEVFIDLYDKLSSHPRFLEFLCDSAAFYDSSAEGDFFDSPIGSVMRDHIVSQLEFCQRMAEEICDFFSSGAFADGTFLPPFESDLDFCRMAKKTAETGGYAKTREILRSYTPMKRKTIKAADRTPESDYYVDLRDTLKNKISALKKAYFPLTISDGEMKRIASVSAERIRIFYSLLTEFDRLYSDEKSVRGICEFNDIKLWAYKLLVTPDGTPTELAAELSESFDSIYIDEYQDVDLIQDLIFRAIAKPRTRFMVGDIKQSIYGFRGAEPSLFMNYRDRFPSIEKCPDSDECTIFMSDNFRCDESIVKFTNTVCSYLFKTGGREITYTDGDDLGFSKLTPKGYSPTPVKIALIDTKKGSDVDSPDGDYSIAESEYITNEIERLVSGEKRADGNAISYSDIAVLYRSASFGAKVASALDRRGIPHTFGSAESIFDRPEVSLTLSILRTVNNPRRDIPLASVLMSPVFGLTAEDILKVNEFSAGEAIGTLYDRLMAYSESASDPLSDKCRDILTEIGELRRHAESLPADKIIRLIYSRYSLLSRSDEASSAALTKLYENSRCYEGDTFKGLYGYLRYIDDMLESGNTVTCEMSSGANAVRLMTIHKSKGLEFPVCFVGGCASAFNRDDTKDLLLYSQSLGVAMDLGDGSGFGRIRTPFRSALSREICDRSSEEEMRVLYVALTRARERLYVTASFRYGVENELIRARMRKCAGTRAAILDGSCYAAWILTAVHGVDSKYFEIDTVYAADILDGTDNQCRPTLCLPEGRSFTESELSEAAEHIAGIFSYSYPYLHSSGLPAKLSVSRLSPDVLDRGGDTPENTDSDSLDLSLPELIKEPIFMTEDGRSQITAAQRGTDTHTFLQFCNFDNVVDGGVKNELERLIRDGFIEERARRSVDLGMIEAFFSSRLFEMLRSAKAVHREQRFNILLPAARFTEDEELARRLSDESLAVQGVIDLVFECADGRLILCDYKTDHLSPAELKDRSLAEGKLRDAHRRQLSYYAAAVKRLFGRSPDQVLIYSLPLGDTVAVVPESID